MKTFRKSGKNKRATKKNRKGTRNKRKRQRGGGLTWLYNTIKTDMRSTFNTWVPGAYTIKNKPWEISNGIRGKTWKRNMTGDPTSQKLKLNPRIKPVLISLPKKFRKYRQ